MKREFLQNCLLFVLTILLMVGAAEVLLRFLPVNSGLNAQEVDKSSPVFRFLPDRDFIYSKGPLLKMVNTGHVNNEGFVNDIDYTPTRTTPLVAIVGDSFVEALMVPFSETLSGRLSNVLGDRAKVFSFGASGAALSQYLVWADYAREKFHPEYLVVVVVGNDFDESLLTYKQAPGFHYFDIHTSGKAELVRVDLKQTTLRKFLRRSALVRYLVLNFNISWFLTDPVAWLGTPSNRAKFTGYVETVASEKKVSLARRAVQEFLLRLPSMSGLQSNKILLILDGFRYPSKDEHEEAARMTSFFGNMRRFFMSEAHKGGFSVLDMDTVFIPNFQSSHELFEFPIDGHWNARAHGLVTGAAAHALGFDEVPN